MPDQIGRLQQAGQFPAQIGGGLETIPFQWGFTPFVHIAYPTEDPINGVNGRVGSAQAIGGMDINTPAGGPAPLQLYYFGRTWHSAIDPSFRAPLVNGPVWFKDTNVNLPGSSVVVLPHTLGALPDFLVVQLEAGGLNQGVDWAVTGITANDITIENFDPVPVNSEVLDVTIWRSHSIAFPSTLFGPVDVVLNGAAPVVVPHTLGRQPDLISVFPFSAGPAPSGLFIVDGPPTPAAVTLRNVAGGQLTARCYFQATHSIQAPPSDLS
jgi:hypothetical protein